MALWGKKDKSAALSGTFTSNNTATVTTSVSQVGTLKVGDLVIIGTDTGLYRVRTVTAGNITVHRNCASQAAVQGFTATPPKYIPDSDLNFIFFVDNTEATVASNRAKGITGPGWWYAKQGTGGRSSRWVTEYLIPMNETAGNAGDREDAVVADS